MVERRPDYEDERVRAWTFEPGEREPVRPEEDPTVMHLDVEREEVFESRTYRLQPSPETLQYLVELAASTLSDLAVSREQVVRFAAGLFHDTTFKFLSKRNKQDGLIDSLLVAAGGGDRCLLLRQDRVQEEEYRQAVLEFETDYLPEGVLAPPLVIALEDWQRYSRAGPFSEQLPTDRSGRA